MPMGSTSTTFLPFGCSRGASRPRSALCPHGASGRISWCGMTSFSPALQQQGSALGLASSMLGQAELERRRPPPGAGQALFRATPRVQVRPPGGFGRRQGIFDGEGGHGGQGSDRSTGGRRVVEELHNFPVIRGWISTLADRERACTPKRREGRHFLLCLANFNRHVATGRRLNRAAPSPCHVKSSISHFPGMHVINPGWRLVQA